MAGQENSTLRYENTEMLNEHSKTVHGLGGLTSCLFNDASAFKMIEKVSCQQRRRKYSENGASNSDKNEAVLLYIKMKVLITLSFQIVFHLRIPMFASCSISLNVSET